MNIASLFAKVGFKINENDLNKVKQSLTAVKNKIDELIASTAEFATTLTKLSKTTGISKKLLQDFHNLGIEAGVATNEVDSMLETMANVANKAYWGLGNQFAQWGLFFGRGETAASALIKTLNKLSVSSPQKQREIANEIGLQLDTALMLAERLKKGGFKTEDYFNLTDKEVDTMHDVNIQLAMMTHRLDNFWKKITATQGENQLRNFKVLNGLIQTILSGFVDLAETKTGTGLIDMFVTGVQVLTPLLDYSESVIGLAEKFFKNLKYFAVTFLGAGAGVLIAKLFGLSTRPLFNSLQEKLDNLINSDSHFGKSLKKTVSSVADFALDLINKYMPNLGKSLGLTEFFKQAKEGKIFTAFNTLIETWIKKFEDVCLKVWNKISNNLNRLVQHVLIDSLTNFIDAVITKFEQFVLFSLILPLMKLVNKIPGVNLDAEIEAIELAKAAFGNQSITDIMDANSQIPNEIEDVREENEEQEDKVTIPTTSNEATGGFVNYEKMYKSKKYQLDSLFVPMNDALGVIKSVAKKNSGDYTKKYAGDYFDSFLMPAIKENGNFTLNRGGNTITNNISGATLTKEEITQCLVDSTTKITAEDMAHDQALVTNYCLGMGASA